MKLNIENYTKPIGWGFFNGRFTCIDAIETDTSYRFQFKDNQSPTLQILWIELNRNGNWDVEDKKYYYVLNYLNSNGHYVSADWFNNIGNVMNAFGEGLKKSM
jgi:hypothetical protein